MDKLLFFILVCSLFLEGSSPARVLSVESVTTVMRTTFSSLQNQIAPSPVGRVLKEIVTVESDVQKSVSTVLDLYISALKEIQAGVGSALDPYRSVLEQTSTAFTNRVSDSTGLPLDDVIGLMTLQGDFIGASVLIGSLIIASSSAEVGFETPYEVGSTTYDVHGADEFYNTRPVLVFSRLAQLAFLTTAFNFKLLVDWQTGNLEKNEKIRAKEALKLSTQLGPTFIKLGQALSIRTDLIPEAYALELRQLQDAVPPFPSAYAKEILREELGVPDLEEIFTSISAEPIASASIGQVYRGALKDGRDVAVKVQRPKILGEIALDLYILRLLTPLQVKVSNFMSGRPTSQEDVDVALSLVNEWGRGFVAEVDYRTEAKNTKDFSAAMKRRGLDAVIAPEVVDEFSDRRIIVTEWIEGTRLDRDASPDVPRLCGVAVNAYLTMLLDTGVLHCDPHPGNLLRTSDGRLCVLDWGMTLQVPRDLQYGLLEFIAHVISEDYEAMPRDFVNLGFSPPSKIDQLEGSGLTEGLAFALRQLKKGGGSKKIQARVKEEFKDRYGRGLSDVELRAAAREDMVNQMQSQLKKEGVDVNDVTGVMEEMSRRNRELFKLPPYVLYVSRAFSTLEGIGLSINEDYAILQECYPYLAKRLFTDDSPRAQEALRAMLYGAGGGARGGPKSLQKEEYSSSSKGGLTLSPDVLFEMSDGFTSYTSSTSSAEEGAGNLLAQRELANLILSEEGNFIQSTLLDEASKLIDAMLRDRYSSVRRSALGNAVAQTADQGISLFTQLSKVPVVGGLATPALLSMEVVSSIDHLLEKDKEDEVSLQLAQRLWTKFYEGRGMGIEMDFSLDTDQPSVSVDQIRSWLLDEKSVLRQLLADESIRTSVASRAGVMGAKFGAKLIHRVSTRVERKLEEQGAGGAGTRLVKELVSRNIRVGKSIAETLAPTSMQEVEY